MNRDDIIRVAREAGFAEWYGTDDPQFLIIIEHFAALVATHEREKCLEEVYDDGRYNPIDSCRKRIRARSEK